MNQKPRILVAPLNWGLGHATRCIPIIDQFLELGAEVMLASDGRALSLLKTEYPDLTSFQLPGYEIKYKGNSMIWNIAKQLPKISRAVLKEKKAIQSIVTTEKIDIIISDNRYGCRSPQTKNIFITHQINIAIPNRGLEFITNKINHYFIKQFDECWIPDFKGKESLAGRLSKTTKAHSFIGPLSRFQYGIFPKKYDLIAVLSGPEPQRSILEEKIIEQVKSMNLKSLIVQGKTEKLVHTKISDSVEMVSFLTSKKLNEAILKSEIVIARSGYSTLMDLFALQKKAILIPTPGQTEQEYLAKRLFHQKRFYYQKQKAFNLEKALYFSTEYAGFDSIEHRSKSLRDTLKTIID